MKQVALAVTIFLAIVPAGVALNSAAEQGQALFDRANAASHLRSPQRSPYEIKIAFRLFLPRRMPLSGVYEEIWASPELWRKEIAVGDFRETMVRNETGQWRVEEGGVEPPELRDFHDAVDRLSDLALLPEERVQNVRQKGSQKCVVVGAMSGLKRTYCFDASTAQLQSIAWRAERTLFTNYASFASISFPRQIRATGRDGVLWDAEVQSIQFLKSLERAWFVQPSGSEPYVTCLNVRPPREIKTPDPGYDPELRRQHVEGVAILNVEVGADGKPRHVQVVHSDNPGFSSAAYDAVQAWRFKPAMCGSLPVPFAVEVEIKFSLTR